MGYIALAIVFSSLVFGFVYTYKIYMSNQCKHTRVTEQMNNIVDKKGLTFATRVITRCTKCGKVEIKTVEI